MNYRFTCTFEFAKSIEQSYSGLDRISFAVSRAYLQGKRAGWDNSHVTSVQLVGG